MALIDSVQHLIDTYGQTYTINVVTSSGFLDENDPSKGPSTSTTSYTFNGYPSQYKQHQIDGSLIKMGDIKLNLGTKDIDFTPTTDDVIIDSESNQWHIISVTPIYNKTTVIHYMLQIRK